MIMGAHHGCLVDYAIACPATMPLVRSLQVETFPGSDRDAAHSS